MSSDLFECDPRPKLASDCLYRISNIAKAGVAASDRINGLKRPETALQELFTLIYEISDEALELAEQAEMNSPKPLAAE